MRVNLDDARDVAIAALRAAGAREPLAAMQVDHLLEGELRGHRSHGLLRLPRIIARIRNGVIDPNSEGSHTWRGEALLQVDGGLGLGPVVAYRALDALAERAERTAISAAVISRASHLGMLAQYVEAAARNGHVLIALTTSEALVHPWGGRHALLGTNPIAIGVPASPDPFVLDMATGIVSMGKVHAYAAAGRELEPGWALDAHGNPTVDAQAASRGSIAPFGGAKGYALGLAFEVLVAAVTGTATGTGVHGTLDDHLASTKGDVFILIKGRTGAEDAIGTYLDLIRSASTQEGVPAVTVPGDRSRRMRSENTKAGIEIPTELWKELSQMAQPVRAEGSL